MKDRVALVTGASSGIGAATAARLLSDGWTVWAAARRVDRMEALERHGARPLRLDLTDDGCIRDAVDAIGRAGPLTAIVNNAGYGSYGAVEDVPLEEARRQFEVNLFGAARLTQLALPLLRAAGRARIVNVTSVGGRIHEPFGAWYHATKFALEGFSDCLRMELKPFGIDVVVVQPGGIRTEWGGIARDTLLARSGDTAYARYARRHAGMLARADRASWMSDPDAVARTIARALGAGRPRTRYATGGRAGSILLMRRLLSDRAFDALMWAGSQAVANDPSEDDASAAERPLTAGGATS